jgi:hypothetical protein
VRYENLLSAGRLGQAVIQPGGPVVAGSWTTLIFTYTAGHPVDDTGYIKIVFRSVSDLGCPQFDDPAAPNYCTVQTTGDCRIEPRWDPKGHTRPWDRAIYMQVRGGFLDTDETIRLVLGDRSGGSRGWRMQTFCVDRFEFKTLIDPIATYEFKELPRSPTLRIVPGEPERAICIVPSTVVACRPFAYHVKLEDRWGNPTGTPRAMTHPGFEQPGVRTLKVTDETTGLEAESNPIDVLDAERPLQVYWADLHGQSEETVGSNSIDDYYIFARDVALIDIAAHQGNDFQVTDAFWQTVNDKARAFNEAGRFVTFPGYEWSGNTPLGGDRNVYFAGEGGAIVHSCADLLPGKRSAYATARTARDLFKALSAQQGPQAFAFAHVGGRYADLGMHDAEIEWAIEVHSAWGTFEWLVEDALRRGYRMGICANSDGHKGRPGASYPGDGEFGSYGGLTCVLAGRLDRESILDALRARHFYATTGHRGLLDVCLDRRDGLQAMMGDVVQVDEHSPMLSIRAVGTAPIERIEVFNGLQVVNTFRSYATADLGCRYKIVWSGAEVRGRARMATWDGQLSVQGNALLGVRPINFMNPDRQPEVGKNRVSWASVTTGGVAGLILTLKEPRAGVLELTSAQRQVTCSIDEVGLDPLVWDCGGLRKRIDIYRLPDRPPSRGISLRVPLEDLHEGDNPIYVKVVQEDGHMAWSSPIYLVRGTGPRSC